MTERKLTLTDVLGYHERQMAGAVKRAQHPLASYETRLQWETERDIHRILADVLREAIANNGRTE